MNINTRPPAGAATPCWGATPDAQLQIILILIIMIIIMIMITITIIVIIIMVIMVMIKIKIIWCPVWYCDSVFVKRPLMQSSKQIIKKKSLKKKKPGAPSGAAPCCGAAPYAQIESSKTFGRRENKTLVPFLAPRLLVVEQNLMHHSNELT
jgi:hypothetical protein